MRTHSKAVRVAGGIVKRAAASRGAGGAAAGPLPELRSEFASPGGGEFDAMPVGVEAVFRSLSRWKRAWNNSDALLLFTAQAVEWHEKTRFHPAFREHAKCLASIIEGWRRLDALLTPPKPDQPEAPARPARELTGAPAARAEGQVIK